MKRDMDLIRKILLAIEDLPTPYVPENLVIDAYEQEQTSYHVYLLIQAGLIKGSIDDSVGIGSLYSEPEMLTWEGHEFLDAARQEDIWKKAKKVVTNTGGATIQIWQSILTKYLLEQIGISS